MQDLIIATLERLTIVVTIAFVMTRFNLVRNLIKDTGITQRQTLGAICMFGIIGIIGTHTGIVFDVSTGGYSNWAVNIKDNEAIINFRVLGVAVAGLLGGVWVGVGAGIIAGTERILLGGFTAYSCGISAIVAGLLTGLLHGKLDLELRLNPLFAILVGAFAEIMQMAIILVTDQFSVRAWNLVNNIGPPMIIVNGIGCSLFVLIIRTILKEEEAIRASQAQKSLKLADATLKYISKGLNQESAKAVCNILINEVNASAVAITDRNIILAHVGQSADHHKENDSIKTEATKKVLYTGQILIVAKEEIGCADPRCLLRAAIIAPLKCAGEIVGTLKFYFKSDKEIDSIVVELVKGLSLLLDYQLEVAEANRMRAFATESELRMLQAQISPHFLHNTLNTIGSLIRINPDRARNLLRSLSTLFRHKMTENSTLEKELEHVKSYLEIQQARYEDKLYVSYEIDDSLTHYTVPALVLQPIVENAVKYSVEENGAEGNVVISIRKDDGGVLVSVADDGIGVPDNKLALLGSEPIESEKGTGTGLYNINRRLIGMLGDTSGIKIKSEQNCGTTVSFTMPCQEEQ